MSLKRILIAEDDDDDFNLLNSALLSIYQPLDIMRTKNGVMLLSIVETSIRPDLIILDLNIPYKDGMMCLKELRNKKYYDMIKIIMYSTSKNPLDIDKCYNLGADFFMVKPNEYETIIKQFSDLKYITNRSIA